MTLVLPAIVATNVRAAKASEADVETPPEPLVERHWYGWQTMLTDAASIGATALTANAGVLTAGYLLGAPIVHLAHERPGAAIGSFGLRVALPIGGALIGLAASDCPNGRDLCELPGLVLGFVGGMLLASITDAVALSWEDRPVTPTQPSFAIAPSMRVVQGGSTWGVSGVF